MGTSAAEQVSRAPSLTQKVAAVGAVATIVALPPRIGTAEQRGVELAEKLLATAEQAIVRCARTADQQVNDHHFQGKSPSADLCRQLKAGEKITWAVYLGLFKHEQAWPCLREALELLLPRGYWLHPRFRRDDQTGKWKFLGQGEVDKLVAEQGWKGLEGSIEPDLILLNKQGFIVRVYDLKFPCPESNPPRWTTYGSGPWQDWSQGDLYSSALRAPAWIVSPQSGLHSPSGSHPP